jgi:hypothetical protein
LHDSPTFRPCGSASEADVERVAVLANKLVAMLTGLIR